MLLVITVGCIPKASRMLFHLVVFTTARGAGPMAIWPPFVFKYDSSRCGAYGNFAVTQYEM